MGTDQRRRRRRLRFDEVAGLYARARPGYPDALFDDLWQLAGLGPAPLVLEIGCGTGQATLPLLRRGASMLAIEIGPSLANLARTRTQAHASQIRIVTADFDEWSPAEPGFDLVLAATAFHWLDPDTRCSRVARSLRPRAYLAILSNEHVSDERGDQFFHASQTAYAEVFGGTSTGLQRVVDLDPVTLEDNLFEQVTFRTYPWTQSFDSRAYLETLTTYSDHRDLSDESRTKLFSRLATVIDDEMGGRIDKHWAACLTLARRR